MAINWEELMLDLQKEIKSNREVMAELQDEVSKIRDNTEYLIKMIGELTMSIGDKGKMPPEVKDTIAALKSTILQHPIGKREDVQDLMKDMFSKVGGK